MNAEFDNYINLIHFEPSNLDDQRYLLIHLRQLSYLNIIEPEQVQKIYQEWLNPKKD